MKDSETGLSAKEAADFFGVSKDALRFYENEGIIPRVPRNSSGYRVYTSSELNWIYLVLNLKRAGLSLESITEFTHLFMDPSPSSLKRQKELLSQQIDEINKKMKMLADTKKILKYKLDIFDDHFAKLESKNLNEEEIEPLWKDYRK